MEPRPILSGSTYVISRRVSQRMYRLRPSKDINQLVLYAAAIAQTRSDVKIHALCVMSNHYHAIVTDSKGKLPLFTETFNKLIAKALNHLQKRQENFWAGSSQVSHVLIGDRPAMLKQMAYVVCNPVEAGLIEKSSDWPGINLWTPGSRKTLRPAFYFRTQEQGGSLPLNAKLTISTPDSMLECDHQAESLKLLKSFIRGQESVIRTKHRESGRPFLGNLACKAIDIFDSPKTPFKPNTDEDGDINPKVSCGSKVIKKKLLKLIEIFVNEYKDCLESLKAGIQDIVFPAGTYRMKACFEHQVSEGGLSEAMLGFS